MYCLDLSHTNFFFLCELSGMHMGGHSFGAVVIMCCSFLHMQMTFVRYQAFSEGKLFDVNNTPSRLVNCSLVVACIYSYDSAITHAWKSVHANTVRLGIVLAVHCPFLCCLQYCCRDTKDVWRSGAFLENLQNSFSYTHK